MNIIPLNVIENIKLKLHEKFELKGIQDSLAYIYDELKAYLPLSRVNCIFKAYNELSAVCFAEVPTLPAMGRFNINPPLPNELRQHLYNIRPGNYLVIQNLENDHSQFAVSMRSLGYTDKSVFEYSLFSTSNYFFFITLLGEDTDIFSREICESLVEILNVFAEEMRNYFHISLSPFQSNSPVPTKAIELMQMCPCLHNIRSLINNVADIHVTVLVTGETGTGKEIVARAIHELSHMKSGPFVKVNCGAIPETLLDSELFGYERGAFTGAYTSKIGFFEQANNGTLLLDEIGELSLHAQVRLLRVIEHKEVIRIGGTTATPINCRIIAATCRDLKKMVEEGSFRKDLWYRLNLYPIHIPILDERKSDIPVLIRYFHSELQNTLGIQAPIPNEAEVAYLISRHWDGNVRELKHVLERAFILARNETSQLNLNFENEQKISKEFNVEEKLPLLFAPDALPTLDQLNAAYLRYVLHCTSGKVKGEGGAAAILNLDPGTLRYKMQRFGIKTDFFRKKSKE